MVVKSSQPNQEGKDFLKILTEFIEGLCAKCLNCGWVYEVNIRFITMDLSVLGLDENFSAAPYFWLHSFCLSTELSFTLLSYLPLYWAIFQSTELSSSPLSYLSVHLSIFHSIELSFSLQSYLSGNELLTFQSTELSSSLLSYLSVY